ncbi:hypothetical protein GY45DRAFT_510545 [Cubamyces sp. BRFM 1775]|nr:hypothetical protein GY45DRAFT_510545 [Cubamyces sp. BRFM 1775]
MSRLHARHDPQRAARLRMWASPRWDCQSAITSVAGHLHQRTYAPGAPTPRLVTSGVLECDALGRTRGTCVNRGRDTVHDVPCPRARRPVQWDEPRVAGESGATVGTWFVRLPNYGANIKFTGIRGSCRGHSAGRPSLRAKSARSSLASGLVLGLRLGTSEKWREEEGPKTDGMVPIRFALPV